MREEGGWIPGGGEGGLNCLGNKKKEVYRGKQGYGNLRARAVLQGEVLLLRVLFGGGAGVEGGLRGGSDAGDRDAGGLSADAGGGNVVPGRRYAVVPGTGGTGANRGGAGAAVHFRGGRGTDNRGEPGGPDGRAAAVVPGAGI